MVKHLRGIMTTAASWAAVWGVAAMFVGEPSAGALCGALAGAGFALLVARAERHVSIDELQYRRIAVWGVLGGLALPVGLLTSALVTHGGHALWIERALVAGIVSGISGGVSAVASLALARRGQVVARPAWRAYVWGSVLVPRELRNACRLT